MNIDDEFEFKPLTEGLGFHKKEVKLSEETKKADTFVVKKSKALPDAEDLKGVTSPKLEESSQEIKKLVADFPNLETDFITTPQQSSIASTLPRNDLRSKQVEPSDLLSRQEDNLKVDPEIFNRKIGLVPEMQPLIKKTEEKIKIEKKLVEKIEPVAPSVWAYVIDMLTVVGITNVFLAVLLLVTEVDVIYVLSHPANDVMTQISTITLFLAVWMFYLLVSRVFFTRSLGEWAMDLQLGNLDESLRFFYPVRIALRCFFSLISGIVLLPLLSVIFRKDILGVLSGIKIHKRSMKWE